MGQSSREGWAGLVCMFLRQREQVRTESSVKRVISFGT